MKRPLLQDGGESDTTEANDLQRSDDSIARCVPHGFCVSCCRRFSTLMKHCTQHKNSKLVVAVLLGQFLSVLLCGTGVTSQLIEEKFNLTVPATQAFLNYAILGCVFGSYLAMQRGFLKILWQNWWKYAILGVIDVEANYIVILAYKYTNLTSVQLLDSFTIACVMVLSFMFLRARYKLINLMGVSLSIIGIVCLVLADIRGERVKHGTNPIKGDLLCLAGSVLYAISNVAQEFLVKKHTIKEYLGLLGVSGSIVSAIQLIVLERQTLVKIEWMNPKIAPLFIGFGICQFLFYSLMPVVIILSSAVLVNLSLLTADFYTFLFGLFLFKYKFSFFYVLAFILIILGVFIYNLRQPSPPKRRDEGENETRQQDIVDDDRMRSFRSWLRGFVLENRTFELSENRLNRLSRFRKLRETQPSSTKQQTAHYGTVGNDRGSKREKRTSESEGESLLTGRKLP